MQIPTLIWRFALIFFHIYLHVICLLHSVTFDRIAFLIISTVVTHHRLKLIGQANLQWCMVT